MTSALHQVADVCIPLRWEELFTRFAPVEVDVGCGKGAFLLWAAQSRPEHNFLGIDRLLLRLRKVDKKIQRLKLDNVRLLRLEAGYVIRHLIPSGSVVAYHIFFPDPWPKRRHHDRRLFTPAFVEDLCRTLRPAGVVNVATDHGEYFQEIVQIMEGSGKFKAESPENLPADARTDFEREFLASGQSICRGRYLYRSSRC